MANFKKMTSAQLNDWYEEKVGYRPQEDDPTMSLAELRSLCKSYDEVPKVKCSWFLLCENEATDVRLHPTLGGVPICKRCNDKVTRLECL